MMKLRKGKSLSHYYVYTLHRNPLSHIYRYQHAKDHYDDQLAQSLDLNDTGNGETKASDLSPNDPNTTAGLTPEHLDAVEEVKQLTQQNETLRQTVTQLRQKLAQVNTIPSIYVLSCYMSLTSTLSVLTSYSTR